jgi:hypothetical protein
LVDFAPRQLKKKHPRCRSCAPNKFSNQAAGGHQSRRENKHAITYRAVYGERLQEQVRYELIPRQDDENGKLLERACIYVADFVFPDETGKIHVVDAKGMRTEVYRIKKKLMLMIHKIRIEEV